MPGTETTQQPACLYCGNALKGRTDKKFCNELCRNAFNNGKKTAERKSIQQVDQSLKRNRKILATIIEDSEIAIVDKFSLVKMGFDSKYHTHQLVNRKNETYKYCYDLGWKEIDGGLKVMIVWDTGTTT
jgi:hypothetical protein